MDVDVVVVGAGLAGLVAATEAASRGLRVLVLDQEGPQSIGGQAFWSLGGLFFIDSASVLYLIGSTMDWQEDDFTAGFVFENPNAKGSCGCGESFTV